MRRAAGFFLALLMSCAACEAAALYEVQIFQPRPDPIASVRHARIDDDGAVQYQGRVWRGTDDFYDIPRTSAGNADDIANGYVAGSVGSSPRYSATVWKNGATQWTSSLDTFALAVNINGEAAGFGGLTTERAYYFSATGAATPITSPVSFGTLNRAHAINDHGVVVGVVPLDPAQNNGFTNRAFTWSPTTPLVIHNDNATFDINNLGDRIGGNEFVTAAGVKTTVPLVAFAMNDISEVVGGDRYWRPGMATALNLDELVPSGWNVTSAQGINDAGQIAAFATKGAFSGLVRLTPIPEPMTTALVALPLLLLSRRRR